MEAAYGKKNVNAVSRRLTVPTVESFSLRDCKRDRCWPITEIASCAFPKGGKFRKREPLNSYSSFWKREKKEEVAHKSIKVQADLFHSVDCEFLLGDLLEKDFLF